VRLESRALDYIGSTERRCYGYFDCVCLPAVVGQLRARILLEVIEKITRATESVMMVITKKGANTSFCSHNRALDMSHSIIFTLG
jgi:hypothetical protein